jgi:lysophospholipase
MTHSIFKEYPETQMGGVSYHWLFESLKTLKNIQNSEYVLNTPLLLLQAGDDSIVKPGGQNQFCEVARNCRKIVFPSSKHEILMERDLIRDQALQMISEFFVATF